MRPSEPQRVARAVARRIAELRVARGFTQEAFAEKLDVSVQYLRRVEYAQTNLTVVQLVRIANSLGVRVERLFVKPKTMAVKVGRPSRAAPSQRPLARHRVR